MNCPVCKRKNPISSLDTGMMRCWWCGNEWSQEDSSKTVDRDDYTMMLNEQLKTKQHLFKMTSTIYKYVSTTEYPEGAIVVDSSMKMYQRKAGADIYNWLDLDKHYQGDRDSLPLFGE